MHWIVYTNSRGRLAGYFASDPRVIVIYDPHQQLHPNAIVALIQSKIRDWRGNDGVMSNMRIKVVMQPGVERISPHHRQQTLAEAIRNGVRHGDYELKSTADGSEFWFIRKGE